MTDNKSIYRFDLDLKRPSTFRRASLIEGDTLNRFIVSVNDNGVSVDLTGYDVLAVFERADHRTCYQDADTGVTAEGNTVTIDLFGSSYTAGLNRCQLQLYYGDDLITTVAFTFEAIKPIMTETAIEGSAEYPALVRLINLLDNMTATATTLAAGSEATVDLSTVEGAFLLALGLPKGVDGTDGADGQEITLRKTDTHIQWQLGSGEWQNLVALSDITPDVSGFVPTTRKVNNKPLSSDITLNATDVGADATGTASSAVSTHDESSDAHSTLMAGKANLVNLGTDGDNSWNSSPLLNNAIGVGTLYTMTDCDEFKPLILATETASGGIVQYAFDGECCGIFMRDGGFISGSTISWGDWLDVATGYTVSSHNTSSTAHSTLMASKVPKSGTTMTGALNARTLGRGQSYGANEFVPKSYVDAAIAAALSSSGGSSSGKT